MCNFVNLDFEYIVWFFLINFKREASKTRKFLIDQKHGISLIWIIIWIQLLCAAWKRGIEGYANTQTDILEKKN